MAGTQRKHSRHFRPSGRKPRRAPAPAAEAPVEVGKAQEPVATPEPLAEPILERDDDEAREFKETEEPTRPSSAEPVGGRRSRYDRDRDRDRDRRSAPPSEEAPPSRRERSADVSAVTQALEHAQHIIDELKSATDEMEIVLELLEEAERQKLHDEREIGALQKALDRIQRFKGPSGRDRDRDRDRDRERSGP